MPFSGACLCGQTKIEVDADVPEKQIACHCTDCQLTSGSAHSTNILIPMDAVKSKERCDTSVSRDESNSVFVLVNSTGSVKQYDSKAASGNTVSRIFCGNCGAAISHKSKAFGDKQALQTGIMYKTFTSVPFEAELFMKDRWTGIPAIPGAAQAQTMP